MRLMLFFSPPRRRSPARRHAPNTGRCLAASSRELMFCTGS